MTEKPQEQGLSLLDIGQLSENVPVGDGKSIKVYGVSAKGIFSIFQRFPQVLEWFKGGVPKQDLTPILREVPEAIAAVIAAGCGHPGDERAEQAAENMTVELQLDVLDAIARLTFRNGFGPFVQRIVALSNQAASVNYGRAVPMNSPPQSKPASQPVMSPNPSGT